MKKFQVLLVAALGACAGCTTQAVERYTLAQNRTGGEMRDQLVMDCLATVAASPTTLPSFSISPGGVASVTDSFTAGDTITWQKAKQTLQALTLTGSRAPRGQWTSDPTAEYQQMEALHAACLWVVVGPEVARPAYDAILADPRADYDNKPHLGVEERLSRIPNGWLRCGRHKDVPWCARLKAHCGDTWVWVMPEDTRAFAEFTLALQDIATLDPTVFTAMPLVVQLTSYELTKLPDRSDQGKSATIATSEFRYVKPQYREKVEEAINEGIRTGKVNLTRAQWLEYTEFYPGQRNSNAVTSLGTAAAGLAGRAQPTRLNPGTPPVTEGGAGAGQPYKFDLIQ